MEFPKLTYDDFYKFLMSLGIILFLVSVGLSIYIANIPTQNLKWIFIVFCILTFGIGIFLMIYAGIKWHENQNFLDEKIKFENDKLRFEKDKLKAEKEKLEAETQLIKQNVRETMKPVQEIKEKTVQEIKEKKTEDEADVALVSYKIASVFPNTISFNFLKDWRVWFLIENLEKKRYNAYIKIRFISDDYKEDVKVGHYGGISEWKLNALDRVLAPGLTIPPKIRERAKQGKAMKIRIFCEIKDEDDELIERKLPVDYVYSYENNSWVYEP